MDSMVDELRAAGDNSLEAYVCFLEDYKKNDRNTCYVFVEGKNDPALYRSLIYQEIPSDKRVVLYPTGSKKNVKRVFDRFDWRSFSKTQIVFIIDRDLMPFYRDESVFSAANLYITDYYSVENSILCEEVFDAVSRDVLGFANNKQAEIDCLTSLYLKAKNDYEKALLPVMANIILWKRKGTRPANYNNFKPGTIFDILNGHFIKKQSDIAIREQLYRESQVPASVFEEAVVNSILIEIGKQYHEIIRGKYLSVFFCRFCNSLRRDKDSIGVSPTAHGRDIHESDIWDIVAPRKRQIASFRDFLMRTVVCFFNN